MTKQRTLPTEPAAFDWVDAGHTLVRVAEALNWNLDDPSKFAERVQLIEYGLSAEVEFATLLSWLGRCSLAHRLDQGRFSSDAETRLRIPDMLVLFEHLGVESNVLVEVKTTKNGLLKIRSSELAAMQDYANRLSLPLLLAWKPRKLGLWLLVDPMHAVKKGGKSILTLDVALKNNLLGRVAGDFMVVPKSDAGLFLESAILEKNSETERGFEALMQVSKAEYRNGCGEPSTKVPWSIAAMIFSNMESETCISGDAIHQSFVVREHAMSAQQILRTAVAFQLGDDDHIRWLHVANKLEHVLAKKTLERELGDHIGTFVHAILHQHPQKWPPFFPDEWNALPGDSTIG